MLPATKRNPVVVCAIQYEPKLHAVFENIAVAQQLCYEAAAKGAKVVVLPELALSGYHLQSPAEAAKVSQTKNGYQTEAFVPITKKFGCTIVFGYVELLEGKFYNSAAVVGPNGLAGNAQKHNLYASDNLWSQPSEQQPISVLTPAGRLGVLICRDAMNKYRESYVHYKQGQKFYNPGDVDTIALLTNWGTSVFSYPDSTWVELVESTRANVIVSNRVGKEKDVTFKGGCAVIDRDRKIYTYGSNFTHEAIVGGLVY
jgi:predicted amidohydrolase